MTATPFQGERWPGAIAQQAWAWPAGLSGGTFPVLFGTGGPPYMIYL